MRGRTRWRIARSDLASGGRALLWLHHPLLPEIESAVLSEDGLILSNVPSPNPIAAALDGKAGPYFAKLLGLLSYLRWAGLGVAPEDATRIGHRRGLRPALGAAPVPEWRALPPGLALAAVAVAASGDGVCMEPEARAIGRAAAELKTEPYRKVAAWAVRSAERGERPESLLGRLARDLEVEDGGEDFLGLLYPVCPGGDDIGVIRPACAGGPGSLFVARGAARRRGPLSFVEVTPGESLEEGSAFRRSADALGKEWGSRLRALISREASTASEGGPVVCLLGRSLSRWDQRSRSAFDALPPSAGFVRFEARDAPAPPWEDRDAIVVRFGLAEVSSTLYLPFDGFSGSIAVWEEMARLSHDDAGRFLLLAKLAASRFRPAEAEPRRAAGGARRPGDGGDPILDAAALLADRFDVAEAAAASDLAEAEVRRRLDEAVLEWHLIEEGGKYRFAEPSERSRRSGRLSDAARRGVVERLCASRIDEGRLAIAALARGDAADQLAARKQFAEVSRRGDEDAGLALLSRAPAEDPDLGDPVWSVELLHRARRDEEARKMAERVDATSLAAAAPERRIRISRLLSRLGMRAKALEIARSVEGAAGRLLEVRILLDSHAEGDAAALLASGADEGYHATPGFSLRWALLRAESASRAKDLTRATRELGTALALLDEPADRESPYETALTAGWVAADLGRPEEAALFFRRARDVAPDEGRRADARVDLQVALYAQGKFGEAERELSEALAYFASTGDRLRYLSALGNRADVLIATGDFRGARADLDRLLPYDREPQRALQFLFTASTLQRLALADGDLPLAERVFDEARVRLDSFPAHDAAREILVLEGARRLAGGDAAGAVAVLEEAGRHAEMRVPNEPLRSRLLRSAAIDLGQGRLSADVGAGDDERRLLETEGRLARGERSVKEALRVFSRWAGSAKGAGDVSARILEWAGRFQAFFRTEEARGLLETGAKAAAMAGLAGAAARVTDLLAALAVPSRREEPAARQRRPAPREVVAEDASTREVFRIVEQIAPTSLPVVIYGETGTGKEVVARELHRLSGRRGQFVAVNVAAIPDTLAEAELFGHARGAFTGADRERRGVLEESSGGTLFLDEVGELPMLVQAKLLRVLQERSVRRLGETVERPLDLRVVAATHRDLPARTAAGLFRQDLYYRLAGADVTLAPLRERPRDLATLVERTLGGRIALSPAARRLVFDYAWPGNVRELVSALESAEVLAAPGRSIDVGHLPRALQAKAAPRGSDPPARKRYFDAVNAARRETIVAALAESSGNRTRAAALLGLSRQSLLYEMKKLKLG